MARACLILGLVTLFLVAGYVRADEDDDVKTHVHDASEDEFDLDDDIGKSRDGSRTDDEVVQREEEAIKLDGLSVSELKELRDKAEKHTFQAEVDRMMKLIINSLYKNKEIFLRELISNASDALDKIRLLSLTDPEALAATSDLNIKIKADKDNNMLHITDTGVGMSKAELVNNLGTIAKSGTSDFLSKMTESQDAQKMNDLIGQFGVGFYSSFLVADRVVVTSKSNDDDQYIWDSDSVSFSVTPDPRGNTLGRGTTISLHMKEEAQEFLDQHKIKELVTKYSQFINFDIFLWDSKTVQEEVPIEEDEDSKPESEDDEDGTVEEESEEKKTETVDKTVWDWVIVNDNKPIWTKKPSEVEDEEYQKFYKSFSKDSDDPSAWTHFVAEGEVTFKSILFVPTRLPGDTFHSYGKKVDRIKLYVRRVFITDNFEDMMPKYLSFVSGVVDSDDLPLNVSRETLQQHKLLKVIKKKLTRKALDMIKKIDNDKYMDFWKEFSTNIKLGVIEDQSNRTRLSKLLRFQSSNDPKELTSLEEYLSRMKEKQEHIYFIAGKSREDVEKSPFVERLLKKGYEVLYLVEAVDEYCIQSLPEFENKKFQNVAKEGLKLSGSEKAKERLEALEKDFEPLLTWLKDSALGDRIDKAKISERLTDSPSALVASQYGWSGNMERIMKAQAYQKAKDSSQDYYYNQKKTLEINPMHPLIKELRRLVEEDPDDTAAKDIALVLYDTATLRSDFALRDSAGFAERIERMLRKSTGISLDEKVEQWEEEDEDEEVGLGGGEDEEEEEEIEAGEEEEEEEGVERDEL